MKQDKFLYILIAILALHVLLPNIVTLNIITYTFIGYMIIIFIQGLKKKEE
jgi:hypothetical protein